MRRWLSLLVLMLFAGQQQKQDLYLTNGEANGLVWRGMSRGEKGMFVTGVKYGAGAASISLSGGRLPSCPTRVDTVKWYAVTNPEVIREVEAFYESATNIPIPVLGAVVHTLMKFNGASKLELNVLNSEFEKQRRIEYTVHYRGCGLDMANPGMRLETYGCGA